MTLAIGFLLFAALFCSRINNDESFVIDPPKEITCTTSEGTEGCCVLVDNCQYIKDIVEKYGIGTRETILFLTSNTCGFQGASPKMCCPKEEAPDDRNTFDEESNKSQESSKESGDDSDDLVENPLSLLPQDCGKNAESRIIGGQKTELDEFPWMVLLEYTSSNGQSSILGCGGVLISKRYVLTAAHCIRSIPSIWHLENVRLGEHDVLSDPDCMDEGNGMKACADPVLKVGIEAEIVHKEYMKPNLYHNDIALLRLQRNVNFTRYIKPICLPNSGTVSSLYWSAGWGQVEDKLSSDVKMKVSLPFYSYKMCSEKYSLFTNGRMQLTEDQMCAGGMPGKDTCRGDSGGPLMRQVRGANATNRWIVDGVVSIGHSPCGLADWPAVYTKVYNYIPWIQSKLRP